MHTHTHMHAQAPDAVTTYHSIAMAMPWMEPSSPWMVAVVGPHWTLKSLHSTLTGLPWVLYHKQPLLCPSASTGKRTLEQTVQDGLRKPSHCPLLALCPPACLLPQGLSTHSPSGSLLALRVAASLTYFYWLFRLRSHLVQGSSL